MISLSVSGKNWILKKYNQENLIFFKENFSLDEITSKLLSIRKINREDVLSFLNPSIKNILPNPNNMTDMKKLEVRQELLVITMEECGELIQACSKALRRGELYEHSDSETELKKEIGDVQTMINLLVEYDVLSWTEIEQREERKREKIKAIIADRKIKKVIYIQNKILSIVI